MAFKEKNKKLGVAQEERRYDLPFNKDASTDFLMLLVALMTFLAVMALGASFVLSGMAERWSSGLENRLTIEIPAEDGKNIRNAAEIESLSDKVALKLKNNANVKNFSVMGKEDIQQLIEPWLGKDALIDTLPLPGMISVEMKNASDEILAALKSDVEDIDNTITLDTHESWLADLLRLTGTLQFATLVITLIIGVTTVIAVGGGVRSKIAIHKADVELLHLMGASDDYITRQFQRHTLILAMRGAAIGTIASFVIMALIGFASRDTAAAMLPDFSLSPLQIGIFLVTPLIAALIAGLTARLTVLRALGQMP